MNELKVYKGIEYIQLTELPEIQRALMLETLNKDLFIKIMIDGKIVSDCVQYKDYSFWYRSVYKPQPEVVTDTKALPLEFNQNLALNS